MEKFAVNDDVKFLEPKKKKNRSSTQISLQICSYLQAATKKPYVLLWDAVQKYIGCILREKGYQTTMLWKYNFRMQMDSAKFADLVQFQTHYKGSVS